MREPGDIVGNRYEILREIAAGGMGTVYEARHRLTQDVVALKVLHPRVAIGDANRQRFLREVSAPANIGHPGIVKVTDAGVDTEDGALFVAMELLHGETLTARVENAKLSLDDKLDLFEEFLEPLAAAHRKGFIHRDLKPDNVYVARQRDGSERLKILDFGIARERDSIDVTMQGTAMGTPDFMSPEQATNARGVTAASDVWAIGVMFYWAITDRMPFNGKTPSAIVLEVLTKPATPIETLDSSVPTPLAQLINSCLSKNPSDRPLHASDLLTKLRAARAQSRGVPPTMAGDLDRTSPLGGVGGAPIPAPSDSGQPMSGRNVTGPMTPGALVGPPGSSPGGAPPPTRAAFETPQPVGPVSTPQVAGGFGTPPGSSPGAMPGSATGPFGTPPGSHPHAMPGSAPGSFGTPPLVVPPSSTGVPPKKGGMSMGLVLGGCVVVLLLGGIGIGVVAVVGGGGSTGGGQTTPPTPTTGQVRVSTDIVNGQLFVDDVPQGAAVNGQVVEMAPGAHRVEVRVGAVAMSRQEITVTAGAFHEAALGRPVSTFDGSLATTDSTLRSGEFVDEYLFNWPGGAQVRAELTSSQFDAYVIIKFPNGQQQDNDDNPAAAGSTDAFLEVTTPQSGTHRVMVTSFRSGETGVYRLTVTGPAELVLNQ